MHKPNSGCGNITFIFRRIFSLWKHSYKAETRQIQHYIVQLATQWTTDKVIFFIVFYSYFFSFYSI